MNFFDLGIIEFLNQFSQDSWVFDKAVGLVEKNGLLKGGVVMALFWFAWFRSSGKDDRRSIVSTLVAAVLAMASARMLAAVLPFRARPLHEDNLDFELPHGLVASTLDGWSSFPSDHAVLFVCLSVGLLFVSRGLGLFAILYTFVVIGVPRVYLGLHYPTDILAGALLGAAFAVFGNLYLARTRLVSALVRMSDLNVPKRPDGAGGLRAQRDRTVSDGIPGIFYPLFFLFSYQVADMFSASRAMLGAVGTLVKSVF